MSTWLLMAIPCGALAYFYFWKGTHPTKSTNVVVCFISAIVLLGISLFCLLSMLDIKPNPAIDPSYTKKPAITATAAPSYSYTRNYDYEPEYIGNRHSYKFHYEWCSSVDDMYEGNKVYGKTRKYLISHGYKPCKRCDP